MADDAKVRLVRCPKCENLLPELPDYTLYQCGGCGAVLKAKKKGILEDGLSEISDEVKGIGISEEGSIVKASDVKMENADEIEGVKELLNERVASNGSSAIVAENREVLTDSDIHKRGKDLYSKGTFHNRKDLNLKSENTVKEIRPPMELLRSRPGVKSDVLYHDEGQSSYGISSYYGHGERKAIYEGHNVGRIENFENDRAELLRKLDELRDQITRSCDVEEKPDSYGVHRATYPQEGLNTQQGVNGPDMGRAPHLSHTNGFVPSRDRYGSSGPDPYVHEGLTSSRGVNKKPLAHNDMGRASNLSHIPSRDRYMPSGPDPYIQNGYPHEFLPYGDIYVPRRTQSQYMHRPNHGHFHGYYDDFNQEPFMLHHQENIFHHQDDIFHKNWHMPPKVDPSSLHNRRSLNEPSNPNQRHHFNPIPARGPNLYQLHSRRPVTLNPMGMNYENDGFNRHVPRKLTVDHRSGRVSYPVAGGAPFITCSNCFEVLKLPAKNVSLEKDQQKMKCGACSSIISFELGNEGFISSISPHAGEIPSEIGEGSMDENMRNWKYDFIYDKKSNSCESEQQLDPLSSTSSLSDDELDKCAYNHPENIGVKKIENGSKSRRSEPERVSLDKTTSRSDVSLNEFSNSCVSRDSTEISKEDHQKVNKGGDSFFTGFIKKSLRDFMKSNQSVENGGSQVSINGHFIADRAVKKAEKLAGPIQPGEYWYDKKAGFWGVMGHPCLGIIMPNIEEFNYDVPEDCAAGNTGVFVNGRELNEKDLDLLASRGLPITKRKYYIIDITGKVVDEQSGEELDGLGKLAPTVEKAKHGFGMKVPRYISQSQS